MADDGVAQLFWWHNELYSEATDGGTARFGVMTDTFWAGVNGD